jgi:2-polyprenyl-3-methyl-5-hydroxy-6-metoxy-1,4-benzoquinol methylase
MLYAQHVTTTESNSVRRDRPCGACVSQHVGSCSAKASALAYRYDIRPLLPPPAAGQVIDIGYGLRERLTVLLADGYDAHGVDVSSEQVELARALGLNGIRHRDYRDALAGPSSKFATVNAPDLLEHLTKDQVPHALDRIVQALTPSRSHVVRVPNPVRRWVATSSMATCTNRHTRHEASGSLQRRQVSAPSRCGPVRRSRTESFSRRGQSAWNPVSGLFKIALAAKTGRLRGLVVTQNPTFVAPKAG